MLPMSVKAHPQKLSLWLGTVTSLYNPSPIQAEAEDPVPDQLGWST